MSLTTSLAIYFIIWWLVLFAVLPFGVRNAAESGIDVEPGHDPGAPTVLGMKSKLIWTTLISGGLFAICWAVYVYRLVTLEELGTLWGLLR